MYKKIKRNTPSILVILFTLLFFSIQSKAVVTVDNSASAEFYTASVLRL